MARACLHRLGRSGDRRLGFVVIDVRDDRTRSLTLTQKYLKLSVTRIRSSSDTAVLLRDPTSDGAQRVIPDRVLENDRRLSPRWSRTRSAPTNSSTGVVLDMLSIKLMRRLRGPALVVFGIIVGTAANIAASG